MNARKISGQTQIDKIAYKIGGLKKFNPLWLSDAIECHKSGSTLDPVMAWHLYSTGVLTESMVTVSNYQLDLKEQTCIKMWKFSFIFMNENYHILMQILLKLVMYLKISIVINFIQASMG